jgi:hypothetical protein
MGSDFHFFCVNLYLDVGVRLLLLALLHHVADEITVPLLGFFSKQVILALKTLSISLLMHAKYVIKQNVAI